MSGKSKPRKEKRKLKAHQHRLQDIKKQWLLVLCKRKIQKRTKELRCKYKHYWNNEKELIFFRFKTPVLNERPERQCLN